ncbi:hypothetical protein EVG20_g9057 [Dentipellis fragilis]|uniref:Uncharacterized protein n=1 Tax=Dentipellis fragilis TaxID=205917 RepID=A0A4Y9Y2F4_9AGAM|nr:hypothetical protein EVG20_g9057 [Dentipellis fragilis]
MVVIRSPPPPQSTRRENSIPGYIFSNHLGSHRHYRFDAMHPPNETLRNPPYILFRDAFSHSELSPPVPLIHECNVKLPQEAFFVCGWYDMRAAINISLRQLFPSFPWRGELVVVPLGTAVPFRGRAKARRNVNRAALEYA